MAKTLDGRTAVVTGGARGIGREIATRLAAAGAHVAVLDAQPATDTVAAITSDGGRAFAIEATIGEDGAIETLQRGLDDRFADGGVDVLVNNIGGGDYRTFETTTADFLDWTWGLNVRVPFLVTQALLPRLNDGGRVVNMSSAGARLALSEVMAYSMCKAAVETFTRILARDLGSRGITVNAVAPGMTDVETNVEVLGDPAAVRQIVEETALSRIGAAADIANVVYSLVAPAGGWITGQTIDASGGFRM